MPRKERSKITFCQAERRVKEEQYKKQSNTIEMLVEVGHDHLLLTDHALSLTFVSLLRPIWHMSPVSIYISIY
jgi:hypothetical protein